MVIGYPLGTGLTQAGTWHVRSLPLAIRKDYSPHPRIALALGGQV
jgi:hypothetical protein